jgi:hypothetical protein
VENILKKVSDFNNSVVFNKACKLVYYFMTALAIALGAGFANGLFLSELRGML